VHTLWLQKTGAVMVTQNKLKNFLGPVKQVHDLYTELEDGGIYISPEQLAAMNRHLDISANGSKFSADGVVQYLELKPETVTQFTAELYGAWAAHFRLCVPMFMGCKLYNMVRWVFWLGVMCGASLKAPKEPNA
jgi:hypothetical protein